MTTTSGGNVSIIDENGDVWITPSAVDKGSLRASDIVCVKKNGFVEGKHKPSSEFPFHRAIYEIRPDIKAIIHAHPPALVSFSIAREIPNTNVIIQAKHICGPIGYASYALPGSFELGTSIAKEFKKGYKAVIMENHGTVIGGVNIMDAFQRFETLEFCARTILFGNTIGKPCYLSDNQIEEFDQLLQAVMPEIKNVEYPSDEREKRDEMCKIVHRACQQGLMISSYGTVSMRWRDNDFLITPTGIPRWDLDLDDIVQIRKGKKEAGKTPSRATWLHQEIYNNNPGVNSIIMTQSPFLMAFSVTKTTLNVRTIPESWIFLQDVPLLNYTNYFLEQRKFSQIISKNTPAVIIQNDSVLVSGDKLLQTFDRLEVAEFSAQSLVMSSFLGKMFPIDDQQIEELRKTFLQ
jgi:L-fuculose-phosphate aldolase